MVEITTRDATEHDLDRLLDIWREQWDIEYQLDSRLIAISHERDELPETVYGLESSDNESDVLLEHIQTIVAEKDGVIVGFVVVGKTLPNPVGNIWHMAIDPHNGQGGVGSKLLDAATHWLKQRRIDVVTVSVPRHHAVQQAFWRAKGASVIQETFYLPIRDKGDE